MSSAYFEKSKFRGGTAEILPGPTGGGYRPVASPKIHLIGTQTIFCIYLKKLARQSER